MANKLIVFAAFVALAQASLAASSASSSDIKRARRKSLTLWWLGAAAAYDAIQDPSSSLRDRGAEHLSYLLEGNNVFLEVAVPSDQLATLKNETGALYVHLKDYLFEGIAVARRCRDWSETEAALDKIRKQFRDKRWVEAYYGLIGATGSQTPVVKAFRDIYDARFHAIKSLAAYKCGMQSEIGSFCGAYTAIKDFTYVTYGQLLSGQ